MQSFKFVFLILLLLTPLKTYGLNLDLYLPFTNTETFFITRGYDSPPTHIRKDANALDLTQNGCAAYGKPVLATEDGILVTKRAKDDNNYGKFVWLKHSENIESIYAHLSNIADNIGDAGTSVTQGQILGFVGNTGNVNGESCKEYPGTHLHFAMYQKQPDGTIVAYKPEPISGYTNLIAGMTLTSDNVLVKKEEPQRLFSIFANAVDAMTNLFTSEPEPTAPILETTPKITTLPKIETPLATNQTAQSVSISTTNNPSSPPIPQKSSDTSASLPFAGVSGSPSPAITDTVQKTQISVPATTPQTISKDSTPPDSPTITFPTFGTIASTTSLTFLGEAEASSTITSNFSTATSTADTNGNWSLTLANLPEGSSTIQFFATDGAGNKSQATSTTIFIDSIKPDISFLIQECGNSFSSASCLIATTTLTFQWSSPASDISSYTLTCVNDISTCQNFDISTSSTSATYTAQDNTLYTFKVYATDTHGNKSTEQLKTVHVVTRPIIINEIGWAGTSATRNQDEWIELYNPTSETINLNQLQLTSLTDSKPTISLVGSLAPAAFYLIERTDDSTISDIPANLTTSFGSGAGLGLTNTGEVLAITYGSTTIDQTPAINTCNGWCGGSSGSYATMERFDPTLPGNQSNNWGTNNGIFRNGLNADAIAIQGTPGKRNSINYLITKEGYLSQNKTLTKTQSPYLVTNNFDVQNNATLSVDPGVVIKFYDTSSALTIHGILNAIGTASNTIAFTSFKDDSFAGDTNGDLSTTSPQAGNWGGIKILGNGSILANTIIRYGGIKDAFTNYWANLRIENASTTITDSIIEYSGAYGIWMKNSSGNLLRNTVQQNNINTNSQSTGIFLETSSPLIADSNFKNNYIGIVLNSGSSPTISNNTFTNNSNFPLQSINGYATYTNNSVSGNGTNGFNLQGTLASDYTLQSNIPFVIENATYTVPQGKTLTIAPTTIIKFQGQSSLQTSGTIFANGTDSQKIIFTSLNDDDCGIGGCGDTNNATTSPLAGDWNNISFLSGSASSTLNNTIIRYGGAKQTLLYPPGALRIVDSSIDVQNSVIEQNYLMGISMQNSTSTTITNSAIKNHHNSSPTFYGINLTSGSKPTIQNTLFQNNDANFTKDGSSSFFDAGGNTPSPLQ